MSEPGVDDPLRALRRARRAYVVPELRLLYISVAKNACTSIKWLLAELAGEDLERLRPKLGFYPNREAGVHDRSAWTRTPRLHQLAPEVRRSISPENGWMVFSVIRDPRVRLFSAWENKFLLRNPGYRSKVDRPWHPRIPTTPADVIEDFTRFVDELEANPMHEALHKPRSDRDVKVRADAHFRPQTDLLAEHLVPYSRIYDLTELDSMVADLTAHVRAHGYDGPDLVLGNTNDTPLPANREVFARGVRESIEKIYAADFDRFGDRWDFAHIEALPMAWTEESFAHVASVIRANERIGDLAYAAKKLDEENARLRARNKVIRGRVRRIRARNARLRERLGAARQATVTRRRWRSSR